MAKAIRFHEKGGPEVLRLEDVTVGDPGPGEARVRHAAIGVNYVDTYVRTGLYPAPLPSGLGTEGAGTVEAVESGIDRLKVDCLGNQIKLMRMRGDRTFINQSAGQIVSALAGDAGVSTDTVEDGIDFPVYLMDSSVGFYEHCARLARKCGFDLYTTDEGDLVFAAFSITSADHTFKFGEQILSASAERSVPLDVVTVIPESPASSGGDDTTSWFVKDPSSHRGEAGGGAIGLIMSDPFVRTKDAAEKTARGRLYFSKRDSVSGTVELMGSPQVKLGQAVALEGVPKAGVDAVYQVMAVRHSLDPWQGFRTVVSLGGMP